MSAARPARRLLARVPARRLLARVPARRLLTRVPARRSLARMPARRLLGHLLLGVLPALPALAACDRTAPGPWHEEGDHRWRELRAPGEGEPGFERVPTSRTGVGFVNALPESLLLRNEILANGSGVAIGDVDGDGLADLYLCRLEGPNALYLNRGGWRFEEASARAGAGLPGRRSRGAAFFDADGDGDLDLVVTVHDGPDALLLNDGSGVFADASDRLVAAPEAGSGGEASTTATLADIDGDGDLDLYVARYKDRWARDLFAPSRLAYDSIVEERDGELRVRPRFREHYRIIHEGGTPKRWEFAEPDALWLNDGRGRFEPVRLTDGRFRDARGAPLARTPDDWGLAARFGDLDGDGDPDLYVANDLESPDHVWLNEGHGTFRALGPLAVRTTSAASMSVGFADVERDGDVDIFVPDMLSRDARRRKIQVPEMRSEPPRPGEIELRPQANRNTLQLSRGDGTWAEVARWAGVAASEWTWGTLFVDVDLDGYQDLLVSTGHVLDFLDADARERIPAAVERGEHWRRARLLFPRLRLPNLAFRNLGDGRFREAEAWGFGPEADISHGMAAGDLDGDGDLDVAVNRLDSETLLLRNGAPRPRVRVRLAGLPPNTRGIGAKVRLVGGPVEPQEEELAAGGLYLSGSEPALAFAAGRRGDPGRPAGGLRLEVRWRSGRVSVVEGVRAGREYEVREAGAGGASPASEPPGPAPLFRDVSELLGHVHAESPFNDFARQPLVPYRLSQLGPGVAWEDLDGDGHPELVVTSGRGGRLAVYRNVAPGAGRRAAAGPEGERADGAEAGPGAAAGGRAFVGVEGLPVTRYDQTAALGLPSADGVRELLVGQMSYEARTPEEAAALPSVVRVSAARTGWPAAARGVAPAAGPGVGSPAAGSGDAPAAPRGAVPGDAAAIGPLALADVDGDGDLDLFVGGRVFPTAYPVPPASRLFRNKGGAFAPWPEGGADFSDAGMVSGATFTDVDGDGDPDLVLAVEWGPVRLFVNESGRFREATAERGLAGHTGRWNGVTAGDLDGDGRLDLVATNRGLNTDAEASADRPLHLYWGDYDGNGTLEVVEARWQPHAGGIAPLEPLSRLARGLPGLRRRMPSHRAYADATLEAVLGPAAERGSRAAATTLAHTAFLNRGDRFEPRPLPAEAQWAPGFGVAVADFDGDGREDVFLTQNFFATDFETPRHDAGRSLWLRGDGRGGLEPVPGRVSGIAVYGDPRGAAVADFDGDGRTDLAVSQNGAATVLYRNVGAAPGLRVRLQGTPGNPDAVGAAVRIVYADGSRGPVREVRSGSGYWSRDGAVQVLGLEEGREPTAVWIRWPGGSESEARVVRGTSTVRVAAPER